MSVHWFEAAEMYCCCPKIKSFKYCNVCSPAHRLLLLPVLIVLFFLCFIRREALHEESNVMCETMLDSNFFYPLSWLLLFTVIPFACITVSCNSHAFPILLLSNATPTLFPIHLLGFTCY